MFNKPTNGNLSLQLGQCTQLNFTAASTTAAATSWVKRRTGHQNRDQIGRNKKLKTKLDREPIQMSNNNCSVHSEYSIYSMNTHEGRTYVAAIVLLLLYITRKVFNWTVNLEPLKYPHLKTGLFVKLHQ